MKLILLLGLVLIAVSNVNGQEGEEHWSGCWTAFPSSSTICTSEFGDEYSDVKKEGCGILNLGKKVLCRRQHVGCKATTCYSNFVQNLCNDQFGNSLPVQRGILDDCSPGFYRHRCCPQ